MSSQFPQSRRLQRARAKRHVLVDYIEQAWHPRNNGSLITDYAMPALRTTLLQSLLLLSASLFRWTSAVPLRRADDCPGYKASNVVRSDSSITADLTLAGSACNLFGPDLTDLKFLAEWQTGMSIQQCPIVGVDLTQTLASMS